MLFTLKPIINLDPLPNRFNSKLIFLLKHRSLKTLTRKYKHLLIQSVRKKGVGESNSVCPSNSPQRIKEELVFKKNLFKKKKKVLKWEMRSKTKEYRSIYFLVLQI